MILTLAIILGFYGCSTEDPTKINEAQILVTIDDKIITVSDFIRRSEYNVRPSYCNGNSVEDKQIILNSLIAEKLIALESEFDLTEPHMQILEGRKEQKMREVLYNRHIYNKVKIDSLELNIVYDNSRKDFIISYITFPDKQLMIELKNSLEDSTFTFEEWVKNMDAIDTIPTRKINYNEDVTEDMYEAFFSKEVQLGQIFGPVMMGDYYSIFRVDGWKESRNLSASQNIHEITTLKKTMKDIKAHIDYRRYINSLMQDKKLQLHAENFEKLVMNIHTHLKELPLDESELVIRDMPVYTKYSMNLSENDVLFTISDKEWTIGDLDDLIRRDPVIIPGKVNEKVLKKILKNSIIKKIEAFYITQDAYEKSIDQHYLVIQEVTVWSDYIKSTQWISHMIQTSGYTRTETDNNTIFNELLNPIFDSLMVKYSEVIDVNEHYFSEINLSSIDMHTFYNEQSHSLVVPLFPITTTKQKVDYLK